MEIKRNGKKSEWIKEKHIQIKDKENRMGKEIEGNFNEKDKEPFLNRRKRPEFCKKKISRVK